MEPVKGMIVPIITPFDNNRNVDCNSLQKLIDFQVSNGTDAVFALGGCGEGTLLSDEQQEQVIATVASKAGSIGLPVLAGVSSTSLHLVEKKIEQFSKYKIDAYVVTLPFYSRTNENEQVRFYSKIADFSDKPIIMYNIPNNVKNDISISAIEELSANPNILGLKESTDDIIRYRKLAFLKDRMKDKFMLYTGSPRMLDLAFWLGFDGAVMAICNILPRECKNCYTTYHENDLKTHHELQNTLFIMLSNLLKNASSSLPSIKLILKYQKLIESEILAEPYQSVNNVDQEVWDYIQNEYMK